MPCSSASKNEHHTTPTRRETSLHWQAWALSGGAAVSVGFARFGYALILPAMKTDLNLSYAQAGGLNTANALGYLTGALLTIFLVQYTGNKRLFSTGLWITLLALLGTGLTRDLHLLALLRFLAGLGAAGTFIAGGVLSGTLGTRAIVVFFSGSGLGMLATGALLPWLFELQGAKAWPWAWQGCALVCAPLALSALWALRTLSDPTPSGLGNQWPSRACWPEFTAYFMFGLGYIAYITFMVAWVQSSALEGLSHAAVTSVMWSLLGMATLLGPWLWKPVFNGRADGIPMAASMSVLAVGAALPLVWPTLAGIWCSAFLVGSSVFMVPSAATGFVKTNLPAPQWGTGLAIATSLFAIGQTIGPVTSGWLSDQTSSLNTGLWCSVVVLIAGALLAWTQSPLQRP